MLKIFIKIMNHRLDYFRQLFITNAGQRKNVKLVLKTVMIYPRLQKMSLFFR